MPGEVIDLDYEVQIQVDSSQQVVISSPRLILPLKPRGGRLPGAAVLWNETQCEVVAARDGRFTLQP